MDEGAMSLLPYGDHDGDVLEELPWPDDVDPAAESGPFYRIGRWMGGDVVIDGPTGHVLRVPTGPDEDHVAGLPAARSLHQFLTTVALWITGLRTRTTTAAGTAEAELLPGYVRDALADVDATGADQPAWSYVLFNA